MVLLPDSVYGGFHQLQQQHLLPSRFSHLQQQISSKMPWVSEPLVNPHQDTRPF